MAGISGGGHGSVPPTSYEFYVTINAQKGTIKGESTRVGHEGKISGLTFSFGVTSPRTAASGQVSGKLSTEPILITKEWGAATPLLYQAAVTKETLKSVLFEFLGTDYKGTESVLQRIKLTNAYIGSYRLFSEHDPASGHTYELEELGFTFQTLEVTHVPTNTTAGGSTSTSARLPSRLAGAGG